MRSALLAILLAVSSASAAAEEFPAATVAVWEQRLATLMPGQSRTEAEAGIAAVRQVPSTYDLHAMDTADLAVYRLDDATVLVVRYRPGTPAAHVVAGAAGGHPPVDGAVLERTVVRLR